MRKIFSLILVLMLSFGLMSTLVACNVTQEPKYSEEYVFNDTHHWRVQTNGKGDPIDYEAHYNPKNKGAGRCKCGYYFPCHNLVFEPTTVDGVYGYAVVDYDEDMYPNYYHVEVPKYYQGENDAEPLPVVLIGQSAFSNRSAGKCDIKIESIKLHEGLLRIDDFAFAGSALTEVVIPDSVKGTLHYTFIGSIELTKIKIGNGITRIDGYTFHNLSKVKEIILGNSVREIMPRSFLGCWQLETVILPASLESIPEGTEAPQNGTTMPLPQYVIFEKDFVKIFIQLTRDELNARTIPLFGRDSDGNLLNPDGSIAHRVVNNNGKYAQLTRTHWGINENWYGSNKVYCLGEWSYDSKGKPVVN